MTRNEMISDVAVGDVLKIRTEYDLIVGRVECLDETTIKVTRVDTEKSKRINYDIIVDFEFESDVEVLDEGKESSEIIKVAEIDVAENIELQPNLFVRREIMKLWGEVFCDRELSLSKGYKEYARSIPKEVKKDLDPYKDKIMYAQKMNEFTATNYRIVGVMADLSNYLTRSRMPYACCLKAMIYYELGNIE